MLMLIDTREPSGPGHRPREPWLLRLLGRLGWPLVITWLFVASLVVDGWAGVAAIFTAIGLISWRLGKGLPRDGLREYRQ